MDHVEHARLVPGTIRRRNYQVSIAVECTKRNTLVVLPTGMGKTVVAVLVMAHRVQAAGGKVLFLAPTKPLVEQHAAFIREAFDGGPVEVFTGDVRPNQREELWRDAEVVCATPQVVQNDIVANRLDLTDVSLLVVDEAHRAVGNYAYVFIADAYRRKRLEGLILGTTASPGSDTRKIQEVCGNLGIEGVEVRTEHDDDVRPYIQDVEIDWKEVKVPPNLRRIADTLEEVLEEKVSELRRLNFYQAPYVSKKHLLGLQGRLQAKLKRANRDEAGDIYRGLSVQAAALKVNHAKELVETQGVGALLNYLDRLKNDDSKAAKRLLADERLAVVRDLADRTNMNHPKLRKTYLILKEQLDRNPESRIIVFTHYRDMADLLTRELEKTPGPIEPRRFVGQASRGDGDQGLTQREQGEILEDFKAGDFNVLVATSVAEEGLDIPSTDLVVFYEPVPSEIRSIQRRGRTGRQESGRVVILITKDTKDEAYHWASKGKEKKMRKQVQALKRQFQEVNASRDGDDWRGWFTRGDQATLDVDGEAQGETAGAADGEADGEEARDGAPEPTPEAEDGSDDGVAVVTDHREFNSEVVRELSRRDVVVTPEQLEVGDFVLSDRLAVERKEVTDYAESLMDGRLFPQVKALRDAYSAPVLILEGGDLGGHHRIEPNALYGSLASIVGDFRVPVLHTRDARETAELLAALARREQREEGRAVALRSGEGAMSAPERLRFVVEGLPGVSAVLATRLLEHFGTVANLAQASEEDLREVEGVGQKKAASIHETLHREYETEGTR